MDHRDRICISRKIELISENWFLLLTDPIGILGLLQEDR
jgi:hypothetical protein